MGLQLWQVLLIAMTHKQPGAHPSCQSAGPSMKHRLLSETPIPQTH